MRARATKEKAVSRQAMSDSMRMGLIIGLIGIGVVGLAVLLYLNVREPVDIRGIVHEAGLSRAHDDNVIYPESNELPPRGGVHGSAWQNCGFYNEPVETKYALHSLEHGAVWISYQPDLQESDVAVLQGFARGQSHILVSPYPGQRSPVVLTAWGIQLEVNSVGDNRIPEFISRYQRGPQTPERGATCASGIGDPIP